MYGKNDHNIHMNQPWVYMWQIHFDIWQNQYNIVKLNKKKFLKEDQLKAIKNWTEDLSRYFSKEGRQIPSKHMQI